MSTTAHTEGSHEVTAIAKANDPTTQSIPNGQNQVMPYFFSYIHNNMEEKTITTSVSCQL